MKESAIQVAVMQHLRLRARYAVAFHVPNGGLRTRAEAGRFRAEGVEAGVPDVCIIHRGQFYGLELKAERGRVSPAQQAMHDRLRAAGAHVAVAFGLDAELAQLEAWGILQ